MFKNIVKATAQDCRRQLSSAKPKPKVRLGLTGAPGVGKGTFAARIGPHFGIPFISTGDLIRAEIKSGSDLGKRIKQISESGQLVSDEIVADMVRKRLSQPDTDRGFLLDGYPRRLTQADQLAQITPLDVVLNISLREDILIQKMISRRVCDKCGRGYNVADIRQGDIVMPPLLPKVEGKCDTCSGPLVQRRDDTEEVVRRRLEIYQQETKPLLDYYAKQGVLLEFNVKRGIEDTPQLIKMLEDFVNKKTA